MSQEALSKSDFVPNGVYTCAVEKVDNTPSAQKQTPQTIVHLSIVSPAEVEFAGFKYKTANKKFSIRVWWTENAQAGARELADRMGVPAVYDYPNPADVQKELLKFNTNNPFIDVAITCEEIYLRKSLTPQEVTAGQRPEKADFALDNNGQKVLLRTQINAGSKSVIKNTLRWGKEDGRPF